MTSPFPDLDALLPGKQGPDWYRDRQEAAARRLDEVPFPGTDQEVWRYSRIGELDLGAFTPNAGPDGSRAPQDPVTGYPGVEAAAAVVVSRDGVLQAFEAPEALGAVRIGTGAVEGEGILGAVADEGADYFTLLNDALAPAPIVIRVPRGVRLERPIVVIDVVQTAGAAVFPRLVVHAGEDSDVTIVQWQVSLDVDAFVAPVTEIDVGAAARVRHLTVQQRGERVWQIASQAVRVGQDATYGGYQAALGGDYARSRTDCRLAGRGATGNLSAVYFGHGEQMLDFRTFQDHAAPDTSSTLLFKGAVDDESRSVYTGLIRVEKDARGTNAFQTNRNIKLSEHAWAESVPNLEIENNDVRCSHASTVGPIDEDQQFYLESRGVPPQVAERLIVAGFFDEVLSELPVPSITDALRQAVRVRLEEGLGS